MSGPHAFSVRSIRGRCDKAGCVKDATHELLGHPGNLVMGWFCRVAW